MSQTDLIQLLNVKFRHEFYNGNEDRCKDLAIRPTADTATFMQSVGILVQDKGDGFAVYLPLHQKDALFQTINDEAKLSLSFELVSSSLDFLNKTALPISMNPLEQGLYFSNSQTRAIGSALHLGVNGFAGPDDIVSKAEFGITADPTTIGFMNLALAQPYLGRGNPEVFPLNRNGQVISPVDLTIYFHARATYWHYFIVPRSQMAASELDLQVSGAGAGFSRSMTQLPNGNQALLFEATQALPLLDEPVVRYDVSGTVTYAEGETQNISIAGLPCASVDRITSVDGDDLTGISEIFVYL